jgi:hypothetical protein
MKELAAFIFNHIGSVFMIVGGFWLLADIIRNWNYITKTKHIKLQYLYGVIAASICCIYIGISIILREFYLVFP